MKPLAQNTDFLVIKMDIEEILRKEERYRRKMQTQWEMYGHKFINKYYKREEKQQRVRGARGNPGSVFLAHQNPKSTTANVKEVIEYVYIYEINDRNLSGIKFYDIDISRHGYSVEYFSEEYKEITKEEFDEAMKLFINMFHFDEIFNL